MQLSVRERDLWVGAGPVQVGVAFSEGDSREGAYDQIETLEPGMAYRCTLSARGRGYTCHVADLWRAEGGVVHIRRRVVIERAARPAGGVRVSLVIPLGYGMWEFFMPAGCYRQCVAEAGDQGGTLSEERLAYPLVLGYDPASGHGLALLRVTPARWAEPPRRREGEASYLHATDLGGLGYRRGPGQRGGAALVACLPYAEAPRSVALDSSMQPVFAFLPADGQDAVEVVYELSPVTADSYQEACFEVFRRALELARPEPVRLPFSLQDAVRYRVEGMAELGRTWGTYTGLHLNFNPRAGVDTPPTGFGTGFNRLESRRYPEVLEYGFTGRQLNNAWVLAHLGSKWDRPGWVELGRSIVASYVSRCAHGSGWLSTVYDVAAGQPLVAFGHPSVEMLHYGVKGAQPGNYLRNMAEAAYDLVLCHRQGMNTRCLEVAVSFGRFLCRLQNPDGSWHRAYTPEGKPVTQPEAWFGRTLKEQKSATATAIPCLVELDAAAPGEGFLRAAERAGQWVLTEMVAQGHYQGGTLDNPNVIDKEAMAYAMTALLALFERTGKEEYLAGARKAGGLALTWNYLWDVPFYRGTRLYDCEFRTRGWGGINIIWAGGVVDIYSLWFAADWVRLAELTGDSAFRRVAELVAAGTQQLMATPHQRWGLVGCGMQEEGFAVSDQGADAGLIRKGDTWGSLGWVYGAGSFGLLRFLDALEGCRP